MVVLLTVWLWYASYPPPQDKISIYTPEVSSLLQTSTHHAALITSPKSKPLTPTFNPKQAVVMTHTHMQKFQVPNSVSAKERCYSNTTVYYRIHEHSECIPVDCGVTNLISWLSYSCVDFTLEVKANVARCVHSSVNKPGVKHNSGLWDVYPLQTLLWR